MLGNGKLAAFSLYRENLATQRRILGQRSFTLVTVTVLKFGSEKAGDVHALGRIKRPFRCATRAGNDTVAGERRSNTVGI
jgi:hypothetical protein